MTDWPVLNRVVREAAERQGIVTVKQAGFVRWLDLQREDREQAQDHHALRQWGIRTLKWGVAMWLLMLLVTLLMVHRRRRQR